MFDSCSGDSEASVSTDVSDEVVRDSVVVHDSVNVIDSVHIIDSLDVKDSVSIKDSLIVKDSVRIKDSVVVKDSVRIKDSVVVKDSVRIIDSVNVKDSVRIIDSVNVKDSVRIIDSVKVRDSVHVVDSVNVKDSVAVRDPEYFLGKCSQENKGTLKSTVIQEELRYFFCDEGTVMWRAASNVDVNNYYVQKSAVTKFVRLDSVAGILAEGERLVVVIRHAERNSDSSSSTPLNANGVQQALELGGKLASSLEYHYGASGSIRTQQTCRYIAAGRAGVDTIADLTVDTLSHMGESWYVKDAAAYNTAKNSNSSWDILSKWAYKNSYSDVFYDFEPRCSEWIDSVAIPFAERAGTDVAFIATHDLLIMPLVVYVSAKNIDIKHYESNKWLNYLAGFAIVLKLDGSRVFYAVKGLDAGRISS
ncbi:MAG: histidine phosphatase family protein [Fibrobacter sp.]|nr:histidine phosphatase family protein [Fibrobacter sp.]